MDVPENRVVHARDREQLVGGPSGGSVEVPGRDGIMQEIVRAEGSIHKGVVEQPDREVPQRVGERPADRRATEALEVLQAGVEQVPQAGGEGANGRAPVELVGHQRKVFDQQRPAGVVEIDRIIGGIRVGVQMPDRVFAEEAAAVGVVVAGAIEVQTAARVVFTPGVPERVADGPG